MPRLVEALQLMQRPLDRRIRGLSMATTITHPRRPPSYDLPADGVQIYLAASGKKMCGAGRPCRQRADHDQRQADGAVCRHHPASGSRTGRVNRAATPSGWTR